MNKRKFISLFSGAMGLDIGLEKSKHWKCVFCLDNDKNTIKTIRINRSNLPTIEDSIENINGKLIRKIINKKKGEDLDLIVGGPPCQSFSVFCSREGIKDVRGQLVFEFLRLIKDLKPKMFLMENVRGLLSMPIIPKKYQKSLNNQKSSMFEHGSLIKMLFKEYNKIGYHVDCFVVNSANYGAPQIRERIMLIGNRFNKLVEFPNPTHSNRLKDKLPSFKTLGDVIGPRSKFKDSSPEIMDFSPRKLHYLKMVPPGGNWRCLPIDIQKESMGKSWYLKGGRSAYWRRLSFEFPSPTVVTMPNHAGTSMCHPNETRALTVKEAAAVQEFPENWKFFGSTATKFRQIGNAVPIKLGEIAGQVLWKLFKDIKNNKGKSISYPSSRIIHIRPHIRTKTYWKNGKSFSGNTSYYDKPNISNQIPLILEI